MGELKDAIITALNDAGITPKKMAVLMPVVDNVAWMAGKLDEAREAIRAEGVVIEYDNGGGQSGIRENPLFKGYESLWKSYIAGMNKILECIHGDVAVEIKEADAPKTVLELVRNKHDRVTGTKNKNRTGTG